MTNSWVTSCEIAPDEYLEFINGLCGIDFIDKSTWFMWCLNAISQQAMTSAKA